MDPEFARFVGCGGDHAALVRCRADHEGLAAPLRVVVLLYRCEEGIHVNM